MNIRRGVEGDFTAIAHVFFESVRNGAGAHYTEEQRAAWAPDVSDANTWRANLEGQVFWVAERNGRLHGFMSLTPDGYLDFAYVLPEAMGKGVAGRLYETVIRFAKEHGLVCLTCDASRFAESFFKKRGWQVASREIVERRGIGLERCRMTISPGI